MAAGARFEEFGVRDEGSGSGFRAVHGRTVALSSHFRRHFRPPRSSGDWPWWLCSGQVPLCGTHGSSVSVQEVTSCSPSRLSLSHKSRTQASQETQLSRKCRGAVERSSNYLLNSHEANSGSSEQRSLNNFCLSDQNSSSHTTHIRALSAFGY